jgi:hypothetical protein
MEGTRAFFGRRPAAGLPLVLASVAMLVLATGCAPEQPDGTEPAAYGTAYTAPLPLGMTPAASILDLMLEPIDTHADALWEAVATVSTVDGTEDIHPETDEEWAELRRQAHVLIEAANLLVIDGRRVAHPDQKVDGPGESTDYTPEEAQAEIDKDPAAFAAFAAAMQGAARGLVAAIDTRDVEQYLDAGSALQEACESCHRRFWYPNSPSPPGL